MVAIPPFAYAYQRARRNYKLKVEPLKMNINQRMKNLFFAFNDMLTQIGQIQSRRHHICIETFRDSCVHIYTIQRTFVATIFVYYTVITATIANRQQDNLASLHVSREKQRVQSLHFFHLRSTMNSNLVLPKCWMMLVLFIAQFARKPFCRVSLRHRTPIGRSLASIQSITVWLQSTFGRLL